ncbi:MAG: hypothetical protein PHT95_02860 [Candidatus Omnitrophica bacterium]|jgi:hypothetical protein|nr:hypothetical protein [Candidatus Omnitrophota bacterium]MDD4013123.1 hypothetical protein [Candidatus Omnitrophota bacterium]
MLKRYQVLLNDWLADFVKDMANSHDMSFSECVRLGLCMYYGAMISELYPEYKFEFTAKNVVSRIRKYGNSPMNEEELHKTVSNIYYEARKAMEYYSKNKAK